LTWDAVSATVINVHTGGGEWIASISASSSSWQAPAAGSYYLVATNEGTWESWGRSNTVTVEGAPDVSSVPNVTSQVYSSSALELFWNHTGPYSYEVRRDGQIQVVIDGASHFDDGLQPGRQYNYEIIAFNDTGAVVWQQGVSATTLGGSENTAIDNSSINLSAKAYSQSAIEVFWNTNNLDASRYYQFTVFQDGVQVANTDGRSFFIEGLTAGTDYQMSVVATDTAGNQTSEAVTVTTFPVDKQ